MIELNVEDAKRNMTINASAKAYGPSPRATRLTASVGVAPCTSIPGIGTSVSARHAVRHRAVTSIRVRTSLLVTLKRSSYQSLLTLPSSPAAACTISAMSSVGGLEANLPGGWRAWIYRCGTRLHGPDPAATRLTWIADERIAIGTVPTAATIQALAAEGVTHIVNCRARAETVLYQDLAVERAVFGHARVAHAPMWDTGWRQHPRRWSAAARFVARALDEDAAARVLIHCKAGVHRSVLVAYAALRLRDHTADEAANLILGHRAEAELLPAYRASVDDWIRERGRGEAR